MPGKVKAWDRYKTWLEYNLQRKWMGSGCKERGNFLEQGTKNYATESHKYVNRKMFGGIMKLFFFLRIGKICIKEWLPWKTEQKNTV